MFDHLPGTATETAGIERLYRDLLKGDPETLLTLSGSNATESQFRESAGKFQQVHIATHGFFASDKYASAYGERGMRSAADRARLIGRDAIVVGLNPGLLSGLAMAGANWEPVAEEDDGLLFSQEIAFLPLSGVDTAVLSACDTGHGRGGRRRGIAGYPTSIPSSRRANDGGQSLEGQRPRHCSS